MMKPLLNYDEQIQHLKNNGIKFSLISIDDAKHYLEYHNNYFKLTAYRKNYAKHPGGTNKGKYINLDFRYLVDLATIDMLLRYQIVHLALDIEHHVKLRLLSKIQSHETNGYSIVTEFRNSLDETQGQILTNELYRNQNNIYCGDIITKYQDRYPIWAFIELIPFGRLISLYKFCAQKYNDSSMLREYYCLLDCKEIRNASAHNNCILNDLSPNTAKYQTKHEVTQALSKIKSISPQFRRLRMSNARMQQLITLLYVHKSFVSSSGILIAESSAMHELITRMFKHIDYYNDNDLIKSSFCFIKIIVDTWYPTKV